MHLIEASCISLRTCNVMIRSATSAEPQICVESLHVLVMRHLCFNMQRFRPLWKLRTWMQQAYYYLDALLAHVANSIMSASTWVFFFSVVHVVDSKCPSLCKAAGFNSEVSRYFRHATCGSRRFYCREPPPEATMHISYSCKVCV